MTADEITAIVTALGDMIDILARAEPTDKIKIYTLGLRMTHDINTNAIDVTGHPLGRDDLGLIPTCVNLVSEGGLEPPRP